MSNNNPSEKFEETLEETSIDSFDDLVEEVQGLFQGDIWQNPWSKPNGQSSLTRPASLNPSEMGINQESNSLVATENSRRRTIPSDFQPGRVVWTSRVADVSLSSSLNKSATSTKKDLRDSRSPDFVGDDDITEVHGAGLSQDCAAGSNLLESASESTTEKIAIVHETPIKQEEEQSTMESQEPMVVARIRDNEEQTSNDQQEAQLQSEMTFLPITVEIVNQSPIKFWIPPQPVKIAIECCLDQSPGNSPKIKAFALNSVQTPIPVVFTSTPEMNETPPLVPPQEQKYDEQKIPNDRSEVMKNEKEVSLCDAHTLSTKYTEDELPRKLAEDKSREDDGARIPAKEEKDKLNVACFLELQKPLARPTTPDAEDRFCSESRKDNSFVSASTKPDDEIPAVDSSALEALKTSAEESFVLQANSTATSSSTQIKDKKCKLLEFSTPKKTEQVEEKVTSEIESRKCDKCNKIFSRADGLRRHQKSMVCDNRIACEKCNRKYKNAATLQVHQGSSCEFDKWVENKERNSFSPKEPPKCDKCKKVFASEEKCDKHEKICQLSKPVRCTHCGKQFTSKLTLKVHQAKSCPTNKLKQAGKVSSPRKSKKIEQHESSSKSNVKRKRTPKKLMEEESQGNSSKESEGIELDENDSNAQLQMMPLSGQSAKFETEGNNSTEAEETATTFDETNNEPLTDQIKCNKCDQTFDAQAKLKSHHKSCSRLMREGKSSKSQTKKPRASQQRMALQDVESNSLLETCDGEATDDIKPSPKKARRTAKSKSLEVISGPPVLSREVYDTRSPNKKSRTRKSPAKRCEQSQVASDPPVLPLEVYTKSSPKSKSRKRKSPAKSPRRSKKLNLDSSVSPPKDCDAEDAEPATKKRSLSNNAQQDVGITRTLRGRFI